MLSVISVSCNKQNRKHYNGTGQVSDSFSISGKLTNVGGIVGGVVVAVVVIIVVVWYYMRKQGKITFWLHF